MLNDIESQACLKLANKYIGFDYDNEYLCKAILNNTNRRINQLKLSNFREYLKILKNQKREMLKFLSNATIHTTFWFREEGHFETLKEDIIAKGIRDVKILCFACSTGEEVYSLAFTLEELKSEGYIDSYFIDASDIDAFSVLKAKKGIYPISGINRFDKDYSQNYNLKKGYFEIKEEIRKNVKFSILNLQLLEKVPFKRNEYDYAFCRNVFIYFSFLSIKKIMNNISDMLNDKGDLFIGHCEIIETGPSDKLNFIGSGRYSKFIEKKKKKYEEDLVLIGGSTGAIPVLKKLLQNLSSNHPPTVVVQHMEGVFLDKFTQEISEDCGVEIPELSKTGIILENNKVYMAREDMHLEIYSRNNKNYIRYCEGEEEFGHKPSINTMFLTAQNSKANINAFLLSGMGKDGSSEFSKISSDENNNCFCQDEESSVVYGLAKVALDMGSNSKVLSISDLAYEISRLK